MTLEELKKEAKAHGYKLLPIKPREKFLPCTCGCNRREHWIAWGDFGKEITLKCCKCGKNESGGTEEEAKKNWNVMIKEESEKLGIATITNTR